jgi:ribonucleoside-diphosphate reductase beta chain
MTNIITPFTPTPTSVFKVRHKSPADMKIFLDESGTVDISRSDIVKYPIFKKQAEAMFANFWKPHEVVLTKDNMEFNNDLDDNERFIFTSNLKRQIVMDSEQSMGLTQAFLPITSDAMVKRCLNYIEFFEELHASSYEHIVRNVYNDPGAVFDEMRDIEQIIKCGKDIAKYYDDLILEIAKYRLGQSSCHSVKRKTWLCLQSINALEGIRFFTSFCTSFAFGKTGRMVGNASIIKLIAGDELLHVAFTTALIRTLPEDDEEFKVIQEETKEESLHIFMATVDEEREWQKYVFHRGSLIGLNEEIMNQELDFLAAKRMRAINMTYPNPSPRTRPLPWMSQWLNEGDAQPAPQETEITSYVQNVQADVSETTFAGFEL